jgi:hypothetical protein
MRSGFANPVSDRYIRPMLRKPLELLPEVAKAFVWDMELFFKAKTVLDRDQVAAGIAWMLKDHLPRATKLRITEVKELFLQMKDHV